MPILLSASAVLQAWRLGWKERLLNKAEVNPIHL